MQTVQNELRAQNPEVNIEIIGINLTGRGIYNSVITSGRTLPWLQDDTQQEVWSSWQVEYRDVRILDSENRLHAVYNLTQNDLGLSSNRRALQQLFLQVAKAIDTDSDKLPDQWELKHFSTLANNASGDADSDGFTNFAEFAWGTNPKDSASVPRLSTGFTTDQKFTVKFRRWTGSLIDYFVETSPDLKTWNGASTELTQTSFKNLFDGTGMGEVTFTTAYPVTMRSENFVRVKAMPRP